MGKIIAEPREEPLADVAPNNWVDALAPRAWRPYLRLMRADRPIGTWLLLWPCWWSLALATKNGQWPDPYMMLLFAAGAFVMRGAGCTLNDIVDRDLDAAVARTRNRPIASGRVGLKSAVAFFLLLSFGGLAILLQFNSFTVLLGISSLGLVAIYPFMKRLTHWPQFILGLTFNWGALMGWAAVQGELALPALVLYAGAIFWTLGYDTVYALQDMEDDALVGIKSTALLFKENSKRWIGAFYLLAVLGFILSGYAGGLGAIFYAGAGLLLLQFGWQLRTLDGSQSTVCLRVFRSNAYAGWIVFLAIVLGKQL
ncbi:MAG: 4-hydroxybenzoate octaprenyltransferase [Sphingomonadales bacterium]